MARHRDFDVPFCTQLTKTLNVDGSSDVTGIFKRCLFELMCHAGEQKDKVDITLWPPKGVSINQRLQFLSVHPDKGDGAASFEAAMATWRGKVPPYLAIKDVDYSYDKLYLPTHSAGNTSRIFLRLLHAFLQVSPMCPDHFQVEARRYL